MKGLRFRVRLLRVSDEARFRWLVAKDFDATGLDFGGLITEFTLEICCACTGFALKVSTDDSDDS